MGMDYVGRDNRGGVAAIYRRKSGSDGLIRVYPSRKGVTMCHGDVLAIAPLYIVSG